MKKVLIIGILMCMLIGATGCGQEEAAESNVTADAVETTKVYVSPDWVQSVIDGNQEESEDYVILECSWGEEGDSPTYTDGHIQGAVHMNTDSIEAEEFWNIRTPEEIETLFEEYGITKDTTVIVYGSNAADSADDRVAFVSLWAGVENVKALDGGLEAYTEAGYTLETESNEPSGDGEEFGTEIPAHPEYVLSVDQVEEKLKTDDDFKLVSIRSYEEFNGEVSGYSYMHYAGEPEGAIWGHNTDDNSYANEDGTTVDIDVINEYLEPYDASTDDEISFYCGTGWRASIPFLVAYEEGVENISMYDGGWFQWLMDGDLPVQVGDPLKGEVEYKTVKDLPKL